MQIYRILLYLIFSLLASPLTKAGDVIQTQPATSGGYEADVIKAATKGDILQFNSPIVIQATKTYS